MRKDGEPYFNHPTRVATDLMVRYSWASSAAVASAFLHDVCEDCEVSIKDIRELFGDDVASIVSSLTNPPGDKRSRAERQESMRARLATASLEARLIKGLDRLDNLRAFTAEVDSGDFRRMYVMETFALLESLEPLAGTLASEVRNECVRVLSL